VICPDLHKTPYPSESAARDAIKNLKRHRRQGVGFLHAYRCGSHWHIGHGHKSRRDKPGRKFR
jgi:hypothetical protein